MIKELQNTLYSEILLTSTIGIEVVEYNDNGLTLSAPLENNINHMLSAMIRDRRLQVFHYTVLTTRALTVHG